jgi:hypothetical protein
MITRVNYYRDFLHRKTVSSISPPFREAILQKIFLEILPFPPFSQMIVHMPALTSLTLSIISKLHSARQEDMVPSSMTWCSAV